MSPHLCKCYLHGLPLKHPIQDGELNVLYHPQPSFVLEGHRKLNLISIHLFIFSSCKIQPVIAIYSSRGLYISGSLLFMRNIKQSRCVTGVQDSGGRGACHSVIRNLAVWRRTQAESFQSERSRLRCLVKEQNIDFAVTTASSSPPTNLFTQRY